MANDSTDGIILVARLLLAALFLIFGWRKLVDYSGTVSRMVQDGAPLPALSAVIAIFMELPVAFAVAVGAFTRPSAALLALYTLGTALIAHRYWTVPDANKVDSMEGFYKNLSVVGGFLLLYIAGAGRFSIDAILGLKSSVLFGQSFALSCARPMRIRKIPWDVMPLLAFLMPRHEARDAKLEPYRLE